MIYTYNDIATNTAFSALGIQLQQAYTTEDIPVLDDSAVLIIMSYNVQDFRGINAQSAMQKSIVDKYTPHVVGVQEFYTSNTVPAIASNMFQGYNLVRTNHKNFNAVASLMSLTDVVIKDFDAQDPNDMTLYGETRCYMKGYISFDNKRICIVNTHLCLTLSYQVEQMSEIMNLVNNEEYFVLTGDFNVGCLSEEDSYWVSMYKPLVDSGYNLANCTEERGFTYTFFGGSSPYNGSRSCPDNIITSGNIAINNVIYDETKFSNLTGDAIDHIPMIAYLTVN